MQKATARIASILTTFFIFNVSGLYAGTGCPALNQLVFQIRDPSTSQRDFRTALQKIGEYLAVDIAHSLDTKAVEVQTLTGAIATHCLCNEVPVLITLLRAGIPLLLGVQEVFPYSEVGFLGVARNEETLVAETSYVAIPDVADKCVIIIDTMLATGGSILDTVKIVEQYGPKKIIVLCAIGAEPGIKRIREYNPAIEIYSAAIDPILNDKGYIVPGLGDAGDRSYGLKR